MGLRAADVLGLDLPQTDKRLLAIVETDGCGSDGIGVSTGCWVGRRTMRIEDYGKMAATFVDTVTGRAVRIAPCPGARDLAPTYALEAPNQWEAYLLGYQRMPVDELLCVQEVELNTPIEQIISRPGLHAICDGCGEEIMNEREVVREGRPLCRSCAGESYYRLVQRVDAYK